MKLATTIFAALLAGVTLGAPRPELTEMRKERMRKRIAQRQSNPPLPADETQNLANTILVNETAHVDYSSNWAGAVVITTGVKSVTGTIVVPTPSIPSGGSSRTQYAASAWVGIDGDSCQTAILQTGVDFFIQGSTITYDAWYEWYPDYAYDFSGITISAGDTIKMTVTASSTSAGTATVQNVSKGQTVTHSFTGQSNHLCETDAEWIVEDFSSGNSLVPFADFNTVTFTGAQATTSLGTVGTTGATIIDIRQGSSVLTDCSASGTSVTCTYV